MLSKFTYFSLGAAIATGQQYQEKNRDGQSSRSTVYNDLTSTYRVPGWMKQQGYRSLLDDATGTVQKPGLWNRADSAISLGSGPFTPNFNNNDVPWQSANVNANDFIRAVKNYQNGPFGNAKTAPGANKIKGRTPHSNRFTSLQQQNNQVNIADFQADDPWAHIKNFWLRDGHLFALILDDNANDMIHGREPLQKQVDLKISGRDDGSRIQRREPMDHHMEHLREFCNYMGGDLWAPSSQEEYDDLMEREGGVCDEHVRSLEDGQYTQGGFNTKVELYLNIHREGYLRCPSEVDFTVVDYDSGDSNQQLERLPCPEDYGNSVRNLNPDDATNNERYSFKTTDPWFADDINTLGMCDSPNKGTNEYAFWRMDESCANDNEDEPYIGSDCFENTSRHRFQKFVESDVFSINNILNNQDSSGQLQKDCVVTTCNNDNDVNGATVFTGPNGDRRAKSEWNMDNCNLQRHTGICRIRAFGCNEATLQCKPGFTRYCGTRSVYERSIVAWVNAETAAVVSAMANLNIVNNNAEPVESDLTKLILAQNNAADTRYVMFASNADEQTQLRAFVQNIRDNNGNDFDVSVEIGTRPFNIQCECECPYDSCVAVNNNWRSNNLLQSDANRGLTFSGDYNCGVRNSWTDIGVSHNIDCGNNFADTCNCHSGRITSECVMINDYEASWRWSTSYNWGNICTNSCCPTYSDNIHTRASIVANNKNFDCFSRGDTYIVRCDAGLHIEGQDESITQLTLRVPSVGECYQPVRCVAKTCGCELKENGYCYNSDQSGNKQLVDGDTLTCRCDEGYYNVGGVNHLPYDILTCNDGSYDRTKMGVCQPVQCANPPNLLDEFNVVIGMPLQPVKNFVGGCVEYRCKDGYVAAGGVAPVACCDANEPENYPSGRFGCYSEIVGTCVRKYRGPGFFETRISITTLQLIATSHS